MYLCKVKCICNTTATQKNVSKFKWSLIHILKFVRNTGKMYTFKAKRRILYDQSKSSHILIKKIFTCYSYLWCCTYLVMEKYKYKMHTKQVCIVSLYFQIGRKAMIQFPNFVSKCCCCYFISNNKLANHLISILRAWVFSHLFEFLCCVYTYMKD